MRPSTPTQSRRFRSTSSFSRGAETGSAIHARIQRDVPRFPPCMIGGGVRVSALRALRLARFGPWAMPGGRARLAVWSVGLGGFLFQVLVLLSYQSFSGILYQE